MQLSQLLLSQQKPHLVTWREPHPCHNGTRRIKWTCPCRVPSHHAASKADVVAIGGSFLDLNNMDRMLRKDSTPSKFNTP